MNIKKKDYDVYGVLLAILIGIFLGYLIGTKLDFENTEEVSNEENELKETIEYVYLLQIAKFDNPEGASNYQKVLSNKEMDTVVVFDGNFYYIYGAIGASEESLKNIQSKFYVLGYDTIIKKELLIDKANSIIDNKAHYDFYSEGIHNLYLSLKNETFIISEKYYINPVDIELFTQLTILMNIKNETLKLKAQMQAYKIIIENL